MSLLRALMFLVLALALVAGGIAPGFAQETHAVPEASIDAPCHDMDGELVSPATEAGSLGDCCDGGDCRCECLQHTQASVLSMRHLVAMAPARLLAEAATASHAPTLILPATRPPIA